MAELSIGLLGCGVVGSAVARGVTERGERLRRRVGCDVRLARVAVRDPGRSRGVDLPPGTLTTNAGCVATDPGVDVVVEAIGGVATAAALVTAALDAGKPVVTANKGMLAEHGPELERIAAANGVTLRYEAAVAGAVPIVRVLRDALGTEPVERVHGVLDGTTNFVLAEVLAGGTVADALVRARSLGYAGAGAADGLTGRDAAAKATILARLCFPGLPVAPPRVLGVGGVSHRELAAWLDRGYAVKQVASITAGDGGVLVRVRPAPVPLAHPLARVTGVEVGVVVDTATAGRLVLTGAGAGGDATASAVLGDLADVLAGLHADGR